MEAQYGLKASLFQEIKKVVEATDSLIVIVNFNYPDINWCDRWYISLTSGKFTDFSEDI